jgi:hypothetical protein
MAENLQLPFEADFRMNTATDPGHGITAFGEPIRHYGQSADTTGNSTGKNDKRFTGKESDERVSFCNRLRVILTRGRTDVGATTPDTATEYGE